MSIDCSARFLEESKIMESFLRGYPLNESNLVCGIFYAGTESKEAENYNKTISYFFERLAKLYYDALSWLGRWGKKEEAVKKILELKKEVAEVSGEFIKFLKGELEGVKKAKLEHEDKFKNDKGSIPVSTEKPFRIYYVRKRNRGEGDFYIYYVEQDFQQEVLEIIEEIRKDETQAYNEARKKLTSISLRATITLLESLLKVADDQEVKDFFMFLKNLVELSLQNDTVREAVLSRFLKLRVDPYFAFPEEGSSETLDSVGYLTYKPLIVWLGYFPSPLSENEVLERIGRKIFKDWQSRYEKSSEEALNLVREELSYFQEYLGSDPNYWISKLYGEGREEFLRKVRKALGLILEGKVGTASRVAFKKEGKPQNEAIRKYYLKGDKRIVLLFISELKYDEVAKGIEALKEALKKGSSYLQKEVKEKIDDYHRFIYFSSVFPDWDFLKEKEKERNKTPGWNEKFLAFLLQLGAFTKALIRYGKDKGIVFLPIFLLDVGGEEENGGELKIWDVVRAFYNHAFPVPAQTLKKDTVKKLHTLEKKGRESIVKNAFLSAISPQKVLKLEFTNELNTSIKRIYLIVENTTVKIGEEPHRIYHVYSVELSRSYLRIEFEDVYYYFADGKSGDANEFQRFLDKKLKEEDSAVICISSDEKSWIFDKKDLRFYPVLYRERKVQIDPKKRQVLGKDAYFIFEKNFQPFLRHVGHKKISEKNLEGFLLVGVKPPMSVPPRLKEEPYVNSVLSLFFVKNLEGETPENETIIIYALLSWLSFLSESYLYGFVKPKFMQKRLLDVSLSRKIRTGKDGFISRSLKLDSGALITELAFLVRRSLMGKFVDNTK